MIGGNRGLGLEIAKALADAGASIFIASRDAARNEASPRTHRPRVRRDCASGTCDVTDPKQVAATVAAAVARFGKIDILVNSAGINVRGPIGEISPDDFDRVQTRQCHRHLAHLPRSRRP